MLIVDPSLSQDVTEFTAIQQFARDPFDVPLSLSMLLGDAKEKILERFGVPKSTVSHPYEGRTSNLIFIFTTMTYDGLSFGISEDDRRNTSQVQGIEIYDKKYKLKFGLVVGSTREDVIAAFGKQYVREFGSQLKAEVEIWETRSDLPYRAGEVVRGDAVIDITFDTDGSNNVTRIVLESIAF